MFLLGIIGLLTGHSQGREYGEFIWPIDILLLVIWCANIVNILATVSMRTIRPIYVSVWFFIASPIWLAVDYAIGNVIWRPGNIWGAPSGALDGSLSDAMLNWWYAHNLFGLWLTPMLIAITYYMVPRITNTPLYSYTLSLISFWGMAFLYTGVGDHHILQSPTPSWLKTIAEVSSWALLDPGLRVHDQHPRDDEGQLGQVLHELTPALHPDRLLLLLPGEHPGSVRGDPAVQQAARTSRTSSSRTRT